VKLCLYDSNEVGAVVGDQVYPVGDALVKASHITRDYTMVDINNRTDFHIDPGDEIFYQLEGELSLHYMSPEQKHEVAVIKEGELFLLSANVPHSPRRGEGSWTLVVERKRRADEQDRFIWFCEKCNTKIYETVLQFNDPSEAVKTAYDSMKANEKLRTCSHCGYVLAA